jgi:hypothetical protein
MISPDHPPGVFFVGNSPNSPNSDALRDVAPVLQRVVI